MLKSTVLWLGQWLLSLLFNIQMYIALFVVGIVYLPYALLRPEGAGVAAVHYCRWVRWSLAKICGLHIEYRGTPPTGEVLVAAKHQSFLDVMMIYGAMPRGRFIMKSELRFAPVVGWYGLKMGCVPVERGKRAGAISKMLADVKSGKALPGQLIIYPQGTRVAPGEVRPYKVGPALLYSQMGQACHPVAINIGVFWPKFGVMRKRGTAVVQFLDPIQPGLSNSAFMAKLEAEIEGHSNALMREAGFAV
jgi:1-acyl-sn-glycerol-3-phosphate acyltransferase